MKITINNKTVSFHKSWNEVEAQKLLEMIGIFTSLRKHDSLKSFQMQLTLQVLGLNRNFWRNLFEDCKNEELRDDVFTREVNELIKVCQFFTDEQLPFEPKLNFTEQKFYKINGLIGPKSNLKNITFGEWAAMDNLYIAYVKTGRAEILNKLIAVMWRPHKPKSRINRHRNYDGDKRVSLEIHESLIDKYANDINNWEMELRYAIFIFIASCRKAIIERFPVLFQKSEFQQNENSGPTNYMELVLRLAGEKLGNYEQVLNRPVKDIFSYLEMLEKDRLRSEARNA